MRAIRLLLLVTTAFFTLSGRDARPPARRILESSARSHIALSADGDHVSVGFDDGSAVSFELRSVSRGRASLTLGASTIGGGEDDLVLDRGTVTELYVRGPSVVEQVFVVAAPPASTRGDVDVVVEVTGLHPRRAEPGRLALAEETGHERLAYGVVRVRDSEGRLLPSSVGAVGNTIVLRYDDRAATYPVIVDPSMWGFSAEFGPGSGAAASSGFGKSMAADGDALVVGAPDYDGTGGIDQGAVYVFRRNTSGWNQIGGALLPSVTRAMARFGASVDIDVVGTRTRVVVGAPGDSNGTTTTGQAYVFEDSGTGTFQQISTLTPSLAAVTTNDAFGASVTIDDNIVAVGAPNHGASNEGGVEVFVKPGVGMFGSVDTFGRTGATANEKFGASIAIAGTTIVVGATGVALGGTASFGAVEVFTTADSMTWTGGTTVPTSVSSPAANAAFGASVAFDGTTLLVGAPSLTRPSGSLTGAAYVFDAPTYSGVAELFSPNPEMLATFGASVAFDGNTYVIGSPGSSSSVSEAGAEFVFTRTTNTFDTGVRVQTSTNPAFGDHVGASVAAAHLTASTELLAGAPTRSGTTTGSGTALIGSFGGSIGDTCSVDSDCAGGHCVDGRCCNGVCGGNNTSDCLACSTAAGATVNGMCATRTVSACMGSGDGGAAGTFPDPRVAGCSAASAGAGRGWASIVGLAFVAAIVARRRRARR